MTKNTWRHQQKFGRLSCEDGRLGLCVSTWAGQPGEEVATNPTWWSVQSTAASVVLLSPSPADDGGALSVTVQVISQKDNGRPHFVRRQLRKIHITRPTTYSETSYDSVNM